MSSKKELSFSNNAELSRLYFLVGNSDFIFFVEDLDKEYEYDNILRRLFENDERKFTIISMGGKPKVKDIFQKYNSFFENKPCFYIVDGDFDLIIHTEDMIRSENFIYLEYYNIENYFIDKTAVHSFMGNKLKKCNEELIAKVNFDDWLIRIIDEAKDLFLIYCAIQKSNPQLQNVARSNYKFLDRNTGFAQKNAYEDYHKEIQSKIPNIDEEINCVFNNYSRIYANNYFPLICGKFLLLSLYLYLRKLSKFNFSQDELRWFLINTFDINKLGFIKDRVNSVIDR